MKFWSVLGARRLPKVAHMLTQEQDTEITLGTGRMLALFFGLVLICAFFFAIGFSFGRKSAGGAVLGGAATTGSESPAGVVRPSAAKNTQPVASGQDLTFYKSVEQKSADASLTPAETPSQPAAPAATAATAVAPATAAAPTAAVAPATAVAQSPTPEPGSAPASTATTVGYYVQVAAVSRQEDAEALVEALKKKQYPAFIAANSSGDKLFHVQVGPYADFKDAETMRARLISDGYNPIVKK